MPGMTEPITGSDIFKAPIKLTELKQLILENIACVDNTDWFEQLSVAFTETLTNLEVFRFRCQHYSHMDCGLTDYYKARVHYINIMMANIPPQMNKFEIIDDSNLNYELCAEMENVRFFLSNIIIFMCFCFYFNLSVVLFTL